MGSEHKTRHRLRKLSLALVSFGTKGSEPLRVRPASPTIDWEGTFLCGTKATSHSPYYLKPFLIPECQRQPVSVWGTSKEGDGVFLSIESQQMQLNYVI